MSETDSEMTVALQSDCHFGSKTLKTYQGSSEYCGGSDLRSKTYGYNSATGNLDAKAGVALTYNDSAYKHAVTSAGTNTYLYDAKDFF
jgi:hypothetical protein